ncbi:MAG: hypothetical protein Ct9H300mP16_07000 [Pseudomonadota bacterium]|nr:MAG: hypothetical protein Ct9H300mP16_07000 [Pseudomonadota bacterium]
MNAIDGEQVFMRSIATRDSGSELPNYLIEIIAAVKLAGYGLILVETPGIGQGDSAIVPLVDQSLYVMTPEFGAASQLEKIDMLDYADLIAINKYDRKGPRMHCVMSASRCSEIARFLAPIPKRCRCLGQWHPTSTIQVSLRCIIDCAKRSNPFWGASKGKGPR